MTDFTQAFTLALDLLIQRDEALLEIIFLSLRVSLTSTVIACVIGLPLGAALATLSFPGKWFVTVTTNTLMGMPPVVLGLILYMALSNAGPFGWLQLLYTPGAMILAQTLLIIPIVIALTRQIIDDNWRSYREQFLSLCVPKTTAISTLLWDTRASLLTVALAGFARAISEVGAVIVVGGNINHLTRVMTTAIALETSKGELALALALGSVLLLISLTINAIVLSTKARASD
ncbi:ABC transporter permease [Chromatiales bacterium (ex Bugula neritina AB1)]|nr:ABC transporter permease [Chromatiales bacterium (ex Bugula neritina AB1)]